MKLSDYKDEKGMEIVGKLLIPMMNMFANPKVAKAMQSGITQMLSAALLNTPKDVKEILAILNDKPVEEFQMDGGVALNGMFELLTDPAMQQLFGLQS